MIDYIEKAKAFAMMAHKGQTDKEGEDYFTAHVAVVADGVEPDPLVKAAAYLHDTVEDTGTTIDTIRAEFPQEVAEAVSVLTREKDMTYAGHRALLRKKVNLNPGDLVSLNGENLIVHSTHTKKNGAVNVEFETPAKSGQKSASLKKLKIVKAANSIHPAWKKIS